MRVNISYTQTPHKTSISCLGLHSVFIPCRLTQASRSINDFAGALLVGRALAATFDFVYWNSKMRSNQ